MPGPTEGLMAQSREVVVVLGVGRSGTSLAMQALEQIGVRVSDNLILPNVSNPKGFYEDADIVEIHKQLLHTLTPMANMPLEEGWLTTPEARRALIELEAIVERYVEKGPGPWAFKDPRTATFLPLWIRLFNQLKIVPRFVLAIRQPEAIIQSFAQQYGNDQASAELSFLLRTLDALEYTGGNCYLLSYENWFSEPQATLQHLADFVFCQPTDISGKEPPVEAKLNRAYQKRLTIQNPMVQQLYQILDSCARKKATNDELMACVQQHREILSAFSPWWRFSANQKKQNAKCKDQLDTAQHRLLNQDACAKSLERQQAAINEWQEAAKAFERLNK